MATTVLINPFEVADAVADDQFLAGWQRAAEYMRSQPGFVGTRLHRATSPDAKFRFVNVAEWQSPVAFRAAVTSEEFRRIAGNGPAGFPALYEVALELDGPATTPGKDATK
jgi:heme-degrading monooxygenase HmoA